MIDAIRIGDVETTFELTIEDPATGAARDISTATTKRIDFRKADGVKIERDGTFVTDGTDGRLKYVTITGDVDVAGTWRYEAFARLASGAEFTSSDASFEVEAAV